MIKRELVAPSVGTIYQVRRHGWRADLLDNEYWQVERRIDNTGHIRPDVNVALRPYRDIAYKPE